MIFTIIGYLICVVIVICLSLQCVVMLFHGGGDCGPLFGNWAPKGSRIMFFVLVLIDILLWWFLIMNCPFHIFIGMG